MKASKTPKTNNSKSNYNLREKKPIVDKNDKSSNESSKIKIKFNKSLSKNRARMRGKTKSPKSQKQSLISNTKDNTKNKTYIFNDFLILIDKKESNLIDIKKAAMKKNQDTNPFKEENIEKDNKINYKNKKDLMHTTPIKNIENKTSKKILQKSSEILYQPTLEDNINEIISKQNSLRPEIFSFLNNKIFDLIMNNKKQSLIVIKLLNLREIKNLDDEFNLSFFERIKKNKPNDDMQNEFNIQNNIILSDEKQEKIFIQNLKNILKQKESFPMIENLFPNSNYNIFGYLNEPLYAMNEISFIRLIMTKYEEEIYSKETKVFCLPNIINDYYISSDNNKDEEVDLNEIQINKHILKFRKFLLNLSYTKDPNNDNNIYHLIIPKNDIRNLNINDTKFSIFDICKLPISFYLYKQEPGELVIIEPECLHFPFCNNKQKTNKIIFTLMWNCMKFNSLQDYIILQKNLNKYHLINIPIIKILINMLNQKGKLLNVDILKTIYEIWNNFIKNENLEKYRNLIIKDDFLTSQLSLNDVFICEKCGNEIFNYFSYEYKNLDKIIYICINCFFNEYRIDNSFRLKNKILFYKYSKEQLISLEKKIVKLIDEKNRLEIYNDITYKSSGDFFSSYNIFENENNLNLLNINSNNNIKNNFNLDKLIYYINAPCFEEEKEKIDKIKNQELFNIFNDKQYNKEYPEDFYDQKENTVDIKLKINDILFQNYKEPENIKNKFINEKVENATQKKEVEKKKPKIKKATNIAELILLDQF